MALAADIGKVSWFLFKYNGYGVIMKKILLATAVAGLTALPASADTIFGGDVTYSYFSPDTEYTADGYAKASSSDGHPSSIEASIEHPLPLIPNIKIRYIDSDTENLTATGIDVDYKYEATDFIFYYEFLDTSLISLDAGFSVSDISNEVSDSSYTHKYDDYIIGGYANAELGVPNTPLSFYAEGVYGFISSDSGTTTTDLQAGVRFALIDTAVKVTLNAGYRVIENDYDDFDGLDGKFHQDGFFGGATIDF